MEVRILNIAIDEFEPRLLSLIKEAVKDIAPNTLDVVMDKKEAAAFLRVSEKTIDKFVKLGHLQCGYVGDMPRFTKKQLLEFINPPQLNKAS